MISDSNTDFLHAHILKSVHAQYIYQKNKMGKPCEKDLPFVALLGEKSCFSGYNKTNNV
jgi:hypothetical protein